jgi:hypothetical protein
MHTNYQEMKEMGGSGPSPVPKGKWATKKQIMREPSSVTVGEKENKRKYKGLRPKADTMSFSFENLGLKVKARGKELQVLKGVTGKIDAKQLVAVMGKFVTCCL